ncbi:MAG TPA: DUF1801 domain-containing protein [Bacteroidetes bacterium]|nr:DUF1801 domain-containing protein [Bacteroidota bacterium]
MAELKTQVNDASVIDFINSVEIEQRKKDCLELLKIFAEVTGEQPKMWGNSIVGYGSYHYESERSAQKGDWMMTGFSPRKQSLTIYIMPGFDKYGDIMNDLGKYKTSVSCLYVKKLSDIDETKLRELIKASFDHMKSKYHS